ncbi:ankyrin repeat and SOCS box protein 2-like [Aplochiton taeniatus]
MAIPGPVGAAVGFDNDYVPFTNLSEAELLQLAIERSLEENYVPHNSYPSGPTPVVERQPTLSLHQRHYCPQPQVNSLASANPPSANLRTNQSKSSSDASIEIGVSFLIKTGNVDALQNIAQSDPNSLIRPNDVGWIALHDAAYYGQVQCLDVLFRAHPHTINHRTLKGQTPLLFAVAMQKTSCVNYLLRAGADPNLTNKERESPLFKGADVNGQAEDGATPLYEACKHNHEATVETLLSLRADANRGTKTGLLPIHVAARRGNTRIMSLLIPITSKSRVQMSGISPIHFAAEYNRNAILEMLIKAGFDVNAQLSDDHAKMYRDQRRTSLYFSVFNGNLEAAEILLEAGANPNLDRFNALLVAVKSGIMDMVTVLVQYGADINASISTDPSTFPSAVMLSIKYMPVLKYLMDNGCDALSCFKCWHGSQPHPPIPRNTPHNFILREDIQRSLVAYSPNAQTKACVQDAGPIILMLLDYVGHVKLCSRLIELLQEDSDWEQIKEKAMPPHPLMQLCRLTIRQSVGIQRLKWIDKLSLPARLIKFLKHDLSAYLDN